MFKHCYVLSGTYITLVYKFIYSMELGKRQLTQKCILMWIRYHDCFDIKFDTDIIMLLYSIWYLFKYLFLKHRSGKICMTSRDNFIHYAYIKEFWFHDSEFFYVYHIFIMWYITLLAPSHINSGWSLRTGAIYYYCDLTLSQDLAYGKIESCVPISWKVCDSVKLLY